MSTMVVTGKQLQQMGEEVNTAYAKLTDRVNALVHRVAALEEAAEKSGKAPAKKAEKMPAADIADR